MKTIINIIFFLTLFQNQEIKVINVSEIYKTNDIIKYKIVNTSDKIITYSVSLEKQKKEWRMIIGDVTNPTSKSTRLFVLNALKTSNNKINLKNLIVLKNSNPKDKYRICISYNVENDTVKKYSNSNVFILKNK